MPNLTLYIDSQVLPDRARLDVLSEACAGLLVKVLLAAPEKVHIVYVPVEAGAGLPIFAELLLREEIARTPPVLSRFMRELDEAIVQHIGLRARIRCFSFAEQFIHARN